MSLESTMPISTRRLAARAWSLSPGTRGSDLPKPLALMMSLVEASNRTAIHFVVLPVTAVHLDDGGLVTIGAGIRARATECLGPVSGESLDVLGVEAVAERMADHVIRHHPTVPGCGKTAQAVVACLEDSLHPSIV